MLFIEKKNLFSPPKGHFCLLLSVLLCFSLTFLASPFFTSSFSVSLLFFSFFLLVLLSLLSLGSFFVSFFISLSSLVVLFHEKNNLKLLNLKACFINPFSLFGFLSCFLLQMPFSCLCFPDFGLCFLFNINVFAFKKTSFLTPIFEKKKGVAIKCLLYEPVFLQNVTSHRFFWANFCQILVDVQKHYKHRYFSTFLYAKKRKIYHFEVLLSGPSWAFLITPRICARNFF